MEYTVVHAKSFLLLEFHNLIFSIKTYLQPLCPQFFASQLSPSNWKKYSFCSHRGTSGTRRWARVCLWKSRVDLCAFLVLSLYTFQPIILQGKELSVIILKPTQPLTLSHASSQISLIRLSHSESWFPQISFPKLDPADFLLFTCLRKLNDEIWETFCLQSLQWVNYSVIVSQMCIWHNDHTKCGDEIN